MSNNQQELLQFLGPGYFIKTIDQEPCIYYKINSHYDIELSGTHRKNHPVDVYVWDISRGGGIAATTIEKHFGSSDKFELKKLLDDIIQKISGFNLTVCRIKIKSSLDRLFSSNKD